MSDPVSALGQARYDGFAVVRDIGLLGMITLRGSLIDEDLINALKSNGFVMPQHRRMAMREGRGVGWMSPDELLLILPYAAVTDTLSAFSNALKGKHFLAVDVSDARAVFRVEGARSAQVLAKLCPVDLPRLEKDELRRTRAAQVAVAFWADDTGYTLVSFRSVAGYVMGLLRHAAQPGSELD